MKKNNLIITGTLFLLVASGVTLRAQAPDDVAARLAARRAAEDSGGAAPQPATPAQDTTATPAATDTTTTNAATTADDDEARRRAAIAAALKEAETNLAAMPTNLAAGLQIITRRNIFDPRRQPWNPVVTAPIQRQVPVETFYLTGTAEKSGKGPLAFFSGSGVPAYPPTRCIGDTINGFRIKSITFDGVKLIDANPNSTNSAEIDLQPTKGLTRSDGGPWKPAYSEITYQTAAPRMARMDGSEPVQQYQAPLMATVVTSDSAMTFAPGDQFPQDDTSGTGRTRGRQRGQGGQGGGGNGRQRGGGFGGNNAFAPAQPEAPAAPPDPAVLARLAARRAAEGN